MTIIFPSMMAIFLMSNRIHRFNSKDRDFDDMDMDGDEMMHGLRSKKQIPPKPTKDEDILPFFDVDVVDVDFAPPKGNVNN